MRASESSKPRTGSAAERPADPQRAWFLVDSTWDDPVWVLKPTNALEEAKSVRLDWSFALPSGGRFTDEPYASLLQACRQLIACIRSRSLATGLAQRARTTAGYFLHLRELVRWMEQAGFSRFADLDATALLQFQRAIAERAGSRRPALSPATVLKYTYLLSYLFHSRADLDDSLQVDPFPRRAHRLAAAPSGETGHWPHTPDNVAVVLVQGAIDLVSHGTSAILHARQLYAQAMHAAYQRGCGADASTNAATRALQQADIVIPVRSQRIHSVGDLARVIDLLYAACFVVISYLVGPRVSEILHLEAGCVQCRGDGDGGGGSNEAVQVIVGAIFKRQPEYHGRPHEWVAPPPAVLAISVLEALSAEHRVQAGRAQLWLRRQRIHGATEWQTICPGPLHVLSRHCVRPQLQRLAAWLGLPQHEGKDWQLSPHQGRKTFARFAALRDSSSLFALAQHLGHRERAVTDHGYAGSDYRLNQEIQAEVLEQSVTAWEHMLATPGLGGRGGAEIMVKRPRFRGARIKQDIKSYARLLVDAGLVLGVCEWGFCVYREEHSACLGNAAGPNPARREPSTCSRCKNFAVSEKHRPYWVEQLRRHEALLNEPALPRQTLRIARDRLDEARLMLRAIDAAPHGDPHDEGNQQNT